MQQLLGSHLDQLESPAYFAFRHVASEELEGAPEVGQTLFHITTLKQGLSGREEEQQEVQQ